MKNVNNYSARLLTLGLILALPYTANAAAISLSGLTWQTKGTGGAIAATTTVPVSGYGNTESAYVSTSGGVTGGVSPLQLKDKGKGSGNHTNGSSVTSSTFSVGANDQLSLAFNFVSTDGGGYADYAWARLVNSNNGDTAWLFTAQATNGANGNVVPGQFLGDQEFDNLPDFVAATVNNGNTVGFDVNSTDWAPLGSSSGQCFDESNTCGATGWLVSEYDVPEAGLYFLEFGVMNWGDQIFDSALAFDFDGLRAQQFGSPSSVPLPAAAWLFGSALLGFAGFKRKS